MTKTYAKANPDKLGFMKIEVREPGVLGLDPSDVPYSQIVLFKKPDAVPKEVAMFTDVPNLYNSIFGILLDELVADFFGFIRAYDKYTVVSYMRERVLYLVDKNFNKPSNDTAFEAKLNQLIDSVVHFGEIWDLATGHGILSLVDSAIATYDFLGSHPWYTIEHGMSRITDGLEAALSGNVIIKKGVRVIGLTKPDPAAQPVNVIYSLVNSHETFPPESFAAVLVTAPFGSVRMFDLSTLEFSYGKLQAIRTLQYDHSTKIFVQFPSRWWDTLNLMQGGSSRTDLPIRTVVYPSYGLDKPVNSKHVLLASYTWANDAVIWGNIDKHTLKEVVVRDLNTLHGTNFTAQEISDNEIVAHTWLEGFALFGPDQFRLMVNGMIPENGVYFAGEHLSTFHAWIYGAINSAARAISEILILQLGENVDDVFNTLKLDEGEFTRESFRQYIAYLQN